MSKKNHARGARPLQPRHSEPTSSRPVQGLALPARALTGVVVAGAVIGGSAAPVLAQEPARTAADAGPAVRRFDIPAGPLSEAVAAYGRATGLVVQDPGAVIGSTRTAGASGEMTDEGALRQLLGGTGVTYRFVSARTIRLERGDLPPARLTERATVLAPLTVTGAQVSASPKYAQPLRDVPQTVTVVPREVIEQQGATSLRDVLRNVSGLTVNAGEGGATPGDNFNLRGFSARSDVFVDGVRDIGGYSRATFNVEQVEVAKGPGSTYTGRGSTGGSINLVTKTPHVRQDYSATAALGNAEYGRATLDANQPLGVAGGAFRLNAQYEHDGVAGLDVVEKENWGIAPSLAFGLGGSTRLTAQYFHAEQDNTPAYGIQSQDSLPRVDTRNFFGLTDLDHENVAADEATLRVEHAVGSTLSLRNQSTWRRSEVDRIVTFASTASLSRSSRSHLTEDENLSNQTTLNAAFETGPLRHTLVGGIEVARERSTFGSYAFSAAPPAIADLNDPDPDDPYTGVATARRPTRDATSTSVGVFAFETLQVAPQLELTGALRYDYFRAQYQDSLGVALDPAGTTTRALTWRAGAVVKPTASGSVYAAVGTSFNPSGETLALDSRGTAGLDPERSRSAEVGTKWDLLRQRLSLSAALFRTEKTNARMTNPADPNGPQILAGEQRVQGAELGLAGKLARWWTVFTNYAFLDSELVEGSGTDVGKPLPNTPRHSGSVWTTFALPRRAEVGGGMRYMGERFVRGSFYVPDYTVFDAEAGVPVGERLTLRLNVYNLADRTYYDNGRFWVPSPGRTVRVSASYDF